MTPFEKRIADRTAGFKALAAQLQARPRVVTGPRPVGDSKPILDDVAMSNLLPQITHPPYFEKVPVTKQADIASDDPDALAKLSLKLLGLENQIADMKRANAYVRAGDIDGLRKYGYSSEGIEKLFNTDDSEGGYTKRDFSRIYASVRRVKTRVAELNALAGRQSVTETTERYMYRECMDSCRILITFSRKPLPWVRELMGRHGFRFHHDTNTWQRMLTKNAIYSTNFLRKELDKKEVKFFE